MTKEESRLSDIVARIIDLRRSRDRINPAWIATEALNEIDPDCSSIELVAVGCHLQLRQIARGLCRKLFEGADESDQPDFFERLQWRYPAVHAKDEEPEYVLRDNMTDADIAYNVARLRREAVAKLAHADALEAWGHNRKVA